MEENKDEKLKLIGQKARERLGELSRELVHAKSEDKEQILAEMEVQREMMETSDLCLD